MRKVLIVLGVLFLTAQLVCAKKQFVEMEYEGNSIKIDDGTSKKQRTVKNSKGKDLKFKSLIGALNYMSLQGWELVDTKSVTSGGQYGGYGSTNTVISYIFSKDVSDETLEQVVGKSYKKD